MPSSSQDSAYQDLSMELAGPAQTQLNSVPSRFQITVKYGHVSEELWLAEPDPSMGAVLEAMCRQFSLQTDTVKLMGVGKGLLAARAMDPALPASRAGLSSGARIVVLGSKVSDLEHVRQSEAASAKARLPTFEHEARVAAQRRRRARDVQPPPHGTQYTFQSYEVLQRPGLQPPADEALKLLYRLASDAGIMAVMQKHHFTVGKLAEMPPEGLVGVDPVCVLGYNTNRGQSIHLRLRTDDLRGFRKYESIRMTLCHELTHNVWGDHDNNFKALCSQLNKEVDEVHSRLRQGVRFASWTGGPAPATDDSEQTQDDRHPALAASAASSGKTLRQMAREARAAHSASPASAPRSALLNGSPMSNVQPHDTAGHDTKPEMATGGGEEDDSDVATMYTHFDAQTDALETRQRSLEQ